MSLTVWFGASPPLPFDLTSLLVIRDDDHGAALAEGVLSGADRVVTDDGNLGAMRRKIVAALSRDSATWRFVRAERAMSASTADVTRAELERWARAFLARRRVYDSLDAKIEHRVALREVAHRLLLVRDRKLAVVVDRLAENGVEIEEHRARCFKCSPTRMCRVADRLNRAGSEEAAAALDGRPAPRPAEGEGGA